jgi:hypothetical protein
VIDLNPLVTELRAKIAATWPELLLDSSAGILEAEHADMIAWSDLAVPFAVILLDEVAESPSPLDEIWYRPEVEIYYVTQVTGGSSGLRSKLSALQAALKPADGAGAEPLTEGQVLDVPRFGWGAFLIPNQVLRDAGRSQRAGRLVVEIQVTEPA